MQCPGSASVNDGQPQLLLLAPCCAAMANEHVLQQAIPSRGPSNLQLPPFLSPRLPYRSPHLFLAGSGGSVGSARLIEMTAPAATPPWSFSDFFQLSQADEHALKRKVAVKLRCKYTDCVNGTSPFAHSVNGIEPYSPQAMAAWYAEYTELKAKVVGQPATEVQTELARLEEIKCKAVVVNGCQVAWSCGTRPNVGYITTWAEANLPKWDTGVERKAGGVDPTVKWECQRFATTNTSSLWALIATVVHGVKTGQELDTNLVAAFTRIRLLVYAEASADEVLVCLARY